MSKTLRERYNKHRNIYFDLNDALKHATGQAHVIYLFTYLRYF